MNGSVLYIMKWKIIHYVRAMNRNLLSVFPLGMTVVCALLVFQACKPQEKPVKFAIVSDLHAQDVPDGKERIQAVVDAANREKVDFLIQLGDFIRLDSTGRSLESVWNGYEGEKYHVLGNHDLDKYTKEEFLKGFGIPGRYYSFDKNGFHFIVLDGNNLYDGERYIPYAQANYYVDSKMRAFVDPEQLEWLKQDLATTDKKCVVFSHQSIDIFMNNGEEVRKVLENENKRAGYKKVVLAFSGHNHSNYTCVINGITYMQINSASYVWIGKPTATEKRYPEEVNKRYGGILTYSMTYTKPLYAIVTLDDKGADIKGTKADFVPPTPRDLNMKDSVGVFPLVSVIEDVRVDF